MHLQSREKKKEIDQKRKMEEVTAKRNKNGLGSNEIETIGIQRESENKIRIKRKIRMKWVYKEKNTMNWKMKLGSQEDETGYQTGKN